ncbi:MAG: amidohydrolase family protein [bacterium]
MNDIYKEILNEVEKIPVIDTHEHLPSKEENLDQDRDILNEYLSHYMSSDLISAGLGHDRLKKVKDSSIPILKRWEIVEPYWEQCRYTGYGRALDISVNKIYNIESINKNTIEELNEKFKEKNKPGHFKYVLKDLCGIKLSILDAWDGRFGCDENLFRRVWQILNYIIPMPLQIPEGGLDVISWLENQYNISINSLDNWMHAFDLELEDNLNNGIIGIKNILGYFRPLKFDKVDYKIAKNKFASDMEKWKVNDRKEGKNIRFSTEVQDFMMHYILSVINKKELFMQVHTGLLEGNGDIITNSNPALMCNLFNDYTDVTFDIFHIGYPYYAETSALGKMFPNVFIDMCWAHIISPAASVQALNDFMDAVPFNKISAFGGDYLFVDAIYGHLHIARKNVSKVLCQKVKENIFSIEKAIEIAWHLFYHNPIKIFDLEEILKE